ncbi:uncharacterized protein LOC144180223 [Haemaphysalis longicornis]
MQMEQLQEQLPEAAASSGNATNGDPMVLLPSLQLPKPGMNDRREDEETTAAATNTPDRPHGSKARPGFFRPLADFLNTNQVVFYIAISCVLTGTVLLFTVIMVYGRGDRNSPNGGSGAGAGRGRYESIPLLHRQSLLAASPESNEGDSGDEEIYTADATRRPIAVFPSQLLDLCNQDQPYNFLAFLPNGRQDRSKWLAHGRHCEVFQVVSLLKRTVLKIMPIGAADVAEGHFDALITAIQCCITLSTLKHGNYYRTPNFIDVQRIACVFDLFPEWLLRNDPSGVGSTESLADSMSSEASGAGGPAVELLAAFQRWKGSNQCIETRHFIVFEMSYAGKPLSRITLRSAVQGRSLIEQASCCLAVAEQALSFRIESVDADKLLVLVTDAATIEYRIRDRPGISVDCAGLKAQVAGCLSFSVADGRGRDGKDEAPSQDEGAFGSPSSNGSAASSGPARFFGNVTWLGAVVDTVLHKLGTEVPAHRARMEEPIFNELISWKERLLQCHSANEFLALLRP